MNNSELIISKLNNKYPPNELESILNGLKVNRKVSLRINNLKSNFEEIDKVLKNSNISFSKLNFYDNAIIIDNDNEAKIRELDIYNDGKIYLQSLSSMIPPLVLDAKANENILDMCAAPGGKTSEICALSNNTVMITACEKNKIRTERLKYNLDKLGCKKVNILNNDSRRLDNFLKFDKILLDAPCSGSGTLNLNEDNNNFNEDLINRSVRFQTELLSKAFELINIGGTIIYSTCSIFDEENDGVVDIVSKKYNFDVEKISINLDKAELLDSKYGLLIKPNEYYEGFYVSKLIKK